MMRTWGSILLWPRYQPCSAPPCGAIADLRFRCDSVRFCRRRRRNSIAVAALVRLDAGRINHAEQAANAAVTLGLVGGGYWPIESAPPRREGALRSCCPMP